MHSDWRFKSHKDVSSIIFVYDIGSWVFGLNWIQSVVAVSYIWTGETNIKPFRICLHLIQTNARLTRFGLGLTPLTADGGWKAEAVGKGCGEWLMPDLGTIPGWKGGVMPGRNCGNCPDWFKAGEIPGLGLGIGCVKPAICCCKGWPPGWGICKQSHPEYGKKCLFVRNFATTPINARSNFRYISPKATRTIFWYVKHGLAFLKFWAKKVINFTTQKLH